MAVEPLREEPTIGRLVKDAQTEISTLMRKEIQLAKSELKVSVTAGGLGSVLLLSAAFFLVLFIIILSVAAAYFINWNGEGLVPALGVPHRLRLLAPGGRGVHLGRDQEAQAGQGTRTSDRTGTRDPARAQGPVLTMS